MLCYLLISDIDEGKRTLGGKIGHRESYTEGGRERCREKESTVVLALKEKVRASILRKRFDEEKLKYSEVEKDEMVSLRKLQELIYEEKRMKGKIGYFCDVQKSDFSKNTEFISHSRIDPRSFRSSFFSEIERYSRGEIKVEKKMKMKMNVNMKSDERDGGIARDGDYDTHGKDIYVVDNSEIIRTKHNYTRNTFNKKSTNKIDYYELFSESATTNDESKKDNENNNENDHNCNVNNQINGDILQKSNNRNNSNIKIITPPRDGNDRKENAKIIQKNNKIIFPSAISAFQANFKIEKEKKILREKRKKRDKNTFLRNSEFNQKFPDVVFYAPSNPSFVNPYFNNNSRYTNFVACTSRADI